MTRLQRIADAGQRRYCLPPGIQEQYSLWCCLFSCPVFFTCLCYVLLVEPDLAYVAQAMLAMEDTGALLRFVQRSNDVDLREGESALRALGRYSELVALYQQRDQHEAALNLLHTLTLSPKDLPTPPQGMRSCSVTAPITSPPEMPKLK